MEKSFVDFTEDEVLTFTKTKRMELAKALTEKGAPTDKDNQTILLHTLDGLDRSSLGRLKIKAEEQANKTTGAAAAVIAKVLAQAGHALYQTDTPVARETPALPSYIPDPEIVEGELDVSPQQMNYDTFMKGFGDSDENR